ncbi:hypothetical protein D3C86_1741660 [compost metagenome]
MVALQVCPELRKHELTVALTALARSAPGSTTAADLPPSSIDTRFISPAACAATLRPTAVEPVNDTIWISACATSASPTSAPPSTRLSTPGGSCACSQAAISRSVTAGASSEGFKTTVQPASSAGASLAVI